MVNIQGKSLLGLQGVPRKKLTELILMAKKMKLSSRATTETVFAQRQVVVNMFWEPSTQMLTFF